MMWAGAVVESGVCVLTREEGVKRGGRREERVGRREKGEGRGEGGGRQNGVRGEKGGGKGGDDVVSKSGFVHGE